MSLLATIRSTILLAFKALPLLLISFIGFLAIGLGNLSLFVLFLGHSVIVPVVVEIMHKATSSSTLDVGGDISQLVPLVPTTGASYGGLVSNFPSYWMAHICFFFGYLLTNAITIYTGYGLPPTAANAPDWAVEARKTRAATLITTTVILWVLVSYLRYSLTGAERAAGLISAFVVLGGLGCGWYFFAQLCGARNSDIFGIVQQMVTQDDSNSKPMTCVYAPKP